MLTNGHLVVLFSIRLTNSRSAWQHAFRILRSSRAHFRIFGILRSSANDRACRLCFRVVFVIAAFWFIFNDRSISLYAAQAVLIFGCCYNLPAEVLAKLRDLHDREILISSGFPFFHFGGGLAVRNLCRERCYIGVFAAIAASLVRHEP